MLLPDEFREYFHLDQAPQWWGSGLIFIAWATVLGLIGWLVARRRDIT